MGVQPHTNLSHQLRTALLIALFLVAGSLMLPRLSEAVPEGVPCTPEPTDMAVSYGDLVTCQTDTIEDTDFFRFSGLAGETMSIQLSKLSGTGDPFMELFDPDGTFVANSFGRIDRTLTKTGVHTIRIYEFGNNATPAYALSLERLAPPSASAIPIRYDQSIDNENNPGADVDLYFFHGTSGDQVTLLLLRLSGTGDPFMELFDPDGTFVANSFGRIDRTLTKTGVHTIRIYEFGNNATPLYRINLQCMLGPCASSLFPTIATTLIGCTTCSPGNTFGANASIANPTARWLEIKAGVYLPDRTPVNLLGDKHIELPPGFTFNGPVFSTTIPNGLPQGTYQFCGLLLERELGRSLAESCHTFTIGP